MVGIPRRGAAHVFAPDRYTRFTSAVLAGLHTALGALIVGSPYHYNTTSRLATADLAQRLHGAARRPGRCAGGLWILRPADLGAARHGGHAVRRRLLRLPLVLLLPARRARTLLLSPALRPRAPGPKFEFGRWLVAASGPGPGGRQTFALKVACLCGLLRDRRGQQLYTLHCV